jgi:hypothetical protein
LIADSEPVVVAGLYQIAADHRVHGVFYLRFPIPVEILRHRGVARG